MHALFCRVLSLGVVVYTFARVHAIYARILALGSLGFFRFAHDARVDFYTVASRSNRLHPNLQVGYGVAIEKRNVSVSAQTKSTAFAVLFAI